MSNLMTNFITKIFTLEFLSNSKVVELEFEPGDLDCRYGGGGAKYFPHQQDEKGQQERRDQQGSKREKKGFKFL